MSDVKSLRFEDIVNGSTLTLNDISSEKWREYEFEGKKVVHIDNPVGLNVSKTGGHRVVDGDGVCHYVPKGWFHLSWKAKPGEPHLVM